MSKLQNKEQLSMLEGSSPAAPGRVAERAAALLVLEFLNEKTGKNFRSVDARGKPTANLELISQRLRSGATVLECKGVILRQLREWKGTDREKYLRPETLFNRTKFESYLGERDGER